MRNHDDFELVAVLRVVRNPTLAEDISQDCFLRAYRALPDFRGDSQVRSWLYRIAHNLALNAVTRRRDLREVAIVAIEDQHRRRLGRYERRDDFRSVATTKKDRLRWLNQ